MPSHSPVSRLSTGRYSGRASRSAGVALSSASGPAVPRTNASPESAEKSDGMARASSRAKPKSGKIDSEPTDASHQLVPTSPTVPSARVITGMPSILS